MKILKLSMLAVLLMLLLPSLSLGQDVISAKDLAQVLKDENTIVISTRNPADYKKIHITGSVNLNHTALYGDMKMLKPTGEIASLLGSKGIRQDMNLVIYGDGSGKAAGRVYWILKYMGAQNVKILDGGMRAWRMARKPVTKNPSNTKAVKFTPAVKSAIYANKGLVLKARSNPNVVLVDVRSPEEFNGTLQTKLRPGHIPSAVNFNFTQVLASDGKLKPVTELKTLFEKAGITKNKEIILYCESSVRAGIVFMALKSALNYPKVRVYDGAYIEWQSQGENQVEVGS